MSKRGQVWLGLAAPLPPPDLLLDLFNRAQKNRNIKSPQLGALLNTSGGYIRQKKHNGTDSFTVADVRAWCEALGITDPYEVGKAILSK
jgi:hypothetical protein